MPKTRYNDLEQQVLSMVLYDGSVINDCSLSPADFSAETHRQIFESMQDLSGRGEAIDPVSVAFAVEKRHGSVDMQYLGQLLESAVSSPRNLQKFSQLIKQAAKARAAQAIAEELRFDIEHGDDDNFADKAIQALMDLDKGNQSYEATLKESLAAALERLDFQFKNPGLPGISTGMKKLDEAIGGFRPQKLYVFAGRPGSGKSALMMNFINAMLKAKIPSIVFSLEMERDELADRLISINGSINSFKMSTGRFDQDDWPRLSAAVTSIQERSLTIVDQPNMPIIPMMRAARRAKQRDNIQAVFVDYIQIIRGTSSRQTALERITEATQLLKQMARELQIPVIALAQLKREADDLSGPANMNHLADASAIEKDADFIGTLFADDERKARNEMLIHIAKNRGGPLFDVPVKYERQYYRIQGYEAQSLDN